jgi:hypothetical protein
MTSPDPSGDTSAATTDGSAAGSGSAAAAPAGLTGPDLIKAFMSLFQNTTAAAPAAGSTDPSAPSGGAASTLPTGGQQ